MNPLFFESRNQPLFGMYHRARGADSGPSRAVVICSPIGQEYVRSYWSLRLLAGQLARRGMHVLRFDYAGIGDSAMSVEEIQSIDHWYQNVDSAVQFLTHQSGAQSVMLLGLRAGATLATQVAMNSSRVNSLLLWEPVRHGPTYLEDLRQMHAEMLDLWICEMQTENSEAAEEILGSRYSRSLIRQWEVAQIDWSNLKQPHFVFDTHDVQKEYRNLPLNEMRKCEFTDDESSWTDLNQLETAWLRPQTTRKIVDRVADTFDRLQRFGVLTPVGVTKS